MKICTSSILGTLPLLAAASGLGLAGTAVAQDGAGLDIAATTGNAKPTYQTDITTGYTYEGGGVAGPFCFFDNGPPADCFGSPASQYAAGYPFAAEAANDFTLVDLDSPDNPCILTSVTVWITFFNGADAPDAITGYIVSVYPDLGDPKQPGGNLADDGTYTGAVVDAQFVPAAGIVPIPITLPLTGTIYEVTIPTSLEVPKNEKLWLAVAPQLEFPPQSALVLTQAGPFDHAAQQIFNLLALPWTEIGGGDCDGDGTVDDLNGDGIADFRELAMNVIGEKGVVQPPFCPWDCGTQDKVVNIVDLLALLGQWDGGGSCDFDGNGVVNIVDLLALLGAWGPCPTPLNDECVDKQDVLVIEPGVNVGVDMRGATPSAEPFQCVPGTHKDVWYCLTFNILEPALANITTTFDVFLELYDGCVCPPGNLKACAPGLPQFGGIQNVPVFPGQQCCLRIINDLDLPNEELKGRIDVQIKPLPTNEICTDAFDAVVTNVNDPTESIFGDTTGAVDDNTTNCGTAADQPLTGTNWYRVIGDGTTYTASLCNPGTDPLGFTFDTQLSVYCGGCNLRICVDGNDDSPDPLCGLTSEVSWCAEAGREYLIVVHGTSAPINEGPYELTIVSDRVPCAGQPGLCGPANDQCTNRIQLPSVPDQCVPFDTTLASTDGPDNPAGLCSDSGGVATAHDLWWNFQVPSTGQLQVDTCEDFTCGTGDFDTDIVVYGPYANRPTDADCDPAALTANIAGCNDDALDFVCGGAAPWHSVVQIPVNAGEWYKIRVGGWQEGDLGTGVLHINVGAAPIGACCVDGVCVGDLEEVDCEAQAGCLIEWRGAGTACATEDCTPPALPCDTLGGAGSIGGNGAADGVNGVRPSGTVGGWCNGSMGVAEDLIVCSDTTSSIIHAEFIDLTSPVGTPSALDLIRVSIYDASAGVTFVDPSVDVPICTIDASISGGSATKAICGGPFFGGDVECWDVTLSCALTAGNYLVSFSFPELGDAQYFIATGTPHPSSGLVTSQIFGTCDVDGDGTVETVVFGGPTGQNNSFCATK